MDKLYTIHLVNRTQICVCEMKPDDCPRGIDKDFHEALATGMLVIEDGDGAFDMIPVSNIMHIECVPLKDEDDDDDEYNLERLFEEDDEDDEDYDDLDEEDEDDE